MMMSRSLRTLTVKPSGVLIGSRRFRRLPDNLILDLTLRQPFLRPESEDHDNVLIASIVVASSKLDISPFGILVVLRLMKSKGHHLRVAPKTQNAPARGRKRARILGSATDFVLHTVDGEKFQVKITRVK
jgi:hypothetical protein